MSIKNSIASPFPFQYNPIITERLQTEKWKALAFAIHLKFSQPIDSLYSKTSLTISVICMTEYTFNDKLFQYPKTDNLTLTLYLLSFCEKKGGKHYEKRSH